MGRPRVSEPEAKPTLLDARSLEERHALILETVPRFAFSGCAVTSAGDIAHALGVFKPTVRYYWGSREKLLEEVKDMHLDLVARGCIPLAQGRSHTRSE